MAARLIDLGLEALISPRYATGAIVARPVPWIGAAAALLSLGVLAAARQLRDWEQPNVDATIVAALEQAARATDPAEQRRLRANAASLLYTTYYNRAREAAKRVSFERVSEATADDAASITLERMVTGQLPLPADGRVGCAFVFEAVRRSRLKDPASDTPAVRVRARREDIGEALHGQAYDPTQVEKLYKCERSVDLARALLGDAYDVLASRLGPERATAFVEAYTLHTSGLLPVWDAGGIIGLRSGPETERQRGSGGLTFAEIGTVCGVSHTGAQKQVHAVEEAIKAVAKARRAAKTYAAQEADCRKQLSQVAREIGALERKEKARRIAQKFYPLRQPTRLEPQPDVHLRIAPEEAPEGEGAWSDVPIRRRMTP